MTSSERRKAQGLLDHFDPASDNVHEHSRMNPRMTPNAISLIPTSQTSSESDVQSLVSDSPLSDADDDSSVDEEFTSINSTRKSARLAAGSTKLRQSKLPFSPKKLRSNRVQRGRSVPDSEDDLGGYGQVNSDVEIIVPTRRSTRARRNAHLNLADDEESDEDTYHDSSRRRSRSQDVPQRFKKKRPVTARPAYGHFRDIGDLDFDPYEDEATSSLRAHRDVCEKCHKRPAHKQLTELKKGRRKIKGDDDESDDNEDHIRGLGGWVRWSEYLGIFSFVWLIYFTASSVPSSPIGDVSQKLNEMRLRGLPVPAITIDGRHEGKMPANYQSGIYQITRSLTSTRRLSSSVDCV